MVVDVAQGHAVAVLVDDDADVPVYASRSKVAVPNSFNSVHAEARTCRIGLQIEHRRFDSRLLARVQLG